MLLFEGYYNSIVLFQGIGINGKGRINYHCKCDLENYSFGVQGDVACLGTIEKDAEHYHPATKEQRNLLFTKMKEAGYEWDTEKKELKFLITNGGNFFETENCKEKTSWSEEDEVRLDEVIRIVESNDTWVRSVDSVVLISNWLKSLKQRYTWKPSVQQMNSISCAVRNMKESACYDSEHVSLFNDLKKLKGE